MSITSSLRGALRPAYRRLRVLLGVQTSQPKKKREKAAKAAVVSPPKKAESVSPSKPATPVWRSVSPGLAGAAAASPAVRPDRAAKPVKSKPITPKAPAPVAADVAPAERARRRRVPVKGKPWNILLLGGSNTVMVNGYLDALIACLEDRQGPVGRITNLAAGGNSTIHGLMLAKQQQDLADYDIVVIEYGVNDLKLSGTVAIEIWKAATEGLVRHLLATRPDVHIVFVLFGRCEIRKSFMFRPADMTLKIAETYADRHRVTVVDIDHLLRDVLFPQAEEFAALYSDGSHYRRPQIARLIGALIASGIEGAPARPLGALPAPLIPGHFAGGVLVDLVGDPGQADRTFVNSRYNIPTRRISLGETVTLDLPGPIAGIEFVSISTGATLRVTEEGEAPFALHTRHARNGPKGFPFLLRCQALDDRPWKTLPRGPRRLTLEALPDAPEGEVKKALKMIPAEAGEAEAVYITRLLCTP